MAVKIEDIWLQNKDTFKMLGVSGRIEFNYKSWWCRENVINITWEAEGEKESRSWIKLGDASPVVTGTQRITSRVTRKATE